MNQMKSHKIQSVLTFIYIFLIPFTAVLYHHRSISEIFSYGRCSAIFIFFL